MTTPTTLKAEQERVLALISAAQEAQEEFERTGTREAELRAYTFRQDVDRESLTLARQYAALLAAHAEALEREAALLEGLTALKKKWEDEYDSHGPEYDYEEAGGVLIGKGEAADELGELLVAQALASAEEASHE